MSIRLAQYGNRLFRQAGTFISSLHNFTVCGFVKLAAAPSGSDYAYIVYIEGAGGSSGNAVYVDAAGNFRGNAEFGAADTGTVGTFTAGGASGANWYFFAWRGTGTGASGMRVSFKAVGASGMTTVPLAFNNATTGVAAMTLGSPFTDGLYGSRTLNGYLSHLKIFNRALTDAEILTESAQTAPTAANLLSYHAFVGDNTTTALLPTQGSGAWLAQEVTPAMSTDNPSLTVAGPTLTGADTLPFVEVTIAPIIITAALNPVTAGIGGSQTLEVSGTGPFTLSTAAGTPPAGLTYSGVTVVIPTTAPAGIYTWTIRATGPTGLTNDRQFTLTVNSALVFPSIVTTALSGGIVGTAYSQTLVATGTAPITWAVTSGALPSGLLLNATTGVISGTPTTAGTPSFTVSATNAAGARLRTFSIAITTATIAPSITTGLTLFTASVGVPYSQGLAATGTSPISWSVVSGLLPDGLTLNASTGAISGTPSTVQIANVGIRATNSAGTDTKIFTLTVLQATLPPTITAPVTLSGGILNIAYSQALVATGTAPITWTIDSGTLPPGLALNSDTGIIFGVPTGLGTLAFVVRATNSVGTTTAPFQITVVGEAVSVGTSATCNSFKVELLQGIHNFSANAGDVFKLALYTPAASLSTSTQTYSASNEVVSAGYVAGGAVLTNITPVLAESVAVADFSNPVFTTLTATLRYALIYNSSKGNRAVALFDFGRDYVLEGSALEVVMPAPTSTSAIVRVT